MARSAGVEFLLFDTGGKEPQAGGVAVMNWDDLERFVIERVAA